VRERVLAAALALGLGLSAVACVAENPECRPVDVGGECFVPTATTLKTHALINATAYASLSHAPLIADEPFEAEDTDGQSIWIVPFRANGLVVGASRFVHVGSDVKLGQVVTYSHPLASFPTPGPGTRLRLVLTGCLEPSATCLFASAGYELMPVGTSSPTPAPPGGS
jgi:hypothetical protein